MRYEYRGEFFSKPMELADYLNAVDEDGYEPFVITDRNPQTGAGIVLVRRLRRPTRPTANNGSTSDYVRNGLPVEVPAKASAPAIDDVVATGVPDILSGGPEW